MTLLSNPRHERFAQELAKGKSASEAYEAAGYKPHQPSASRLLSKAIVAARVTELQAKVAEKAEITALDIVRQLDEDRQLAVSLGQSSAAVSATMGKAKLLGLIVDKADVTNHVRIEDLLARLM